MGKPVSVAPYVRLTFHMVFIYTPEYALDKYTNLVFTLYLCSKCISARNIHQIHIHSMSVSKHCHALGQCSFGKEGQSSLSHASKTGMPDNTSILALTLCYNVMFIYGYYMCCISLRILVTGMGFQKIGVGFQKILDNCQKVLNSLNSISSHMGKSKYI